LSEYNFVSFYPRVCLGENKVGGGGGGGASETYKIQKCTLLSDRIPFFP